MFLKVLVSSSVLCAMGAPGSDDPFKPIGPNDPIGDALNSINSKEDQDFADKMVKEVTAKAPWDDDKSDKEFQNVLQELKGKISDYKGSGSDPASDELSLSPEMEKELKMQDSMVDGGVGGIADAIAKGATEDSWDSSVGGLDSVSYENDPMHRKDPLKDPNADKVLDALGLTEEEKRALKTEKRQKTTIDIAIDNCYAETHEHGCSDAASPFRCLAKAVKQKAAEISEKCRGSTEKALPYACSVELFVTHCDGIQKPLIPCLDEHHPKLGPECLDVLTVTKKVVQTLKKKKNMAGLHDDHETSMLAKIFYIVSAVVGVALAVYFYRGGTTKDLKYKFEGTSRRIKLIMNGKDPYAEKLAGNNDWTSNVDSSDKDMGAVNLNNFGGYGGLS